LRDGAFRLDLEIYVPAASGVELTAGDRVRAGSGVIATWRRQ